MKSKLLPLLLLLILFGIIGCQSSEPLSTLPVATATATLRPTPTLRPALQTLTPVAQPDQESNEQSAQADSNAAESAQTENQTESDGEVALEGAEVDALGAAAETNQLAVTLTPFPPAVELLPIAERSLELGDSQTAAAQFNAVVNDPESSAEMIRSALWGLARAQYDNNRPQEAKLVFETYLDQTPNPNSAAFYFLAKLTESDPPTAVAYYNRYLESNPDMGAYIFPKVAQLDPTNAITYYQAGLNSDAQYLVEVEARRRLAGLYLQAADYDNVIAQYARIRDIARTEATRGEMTYLIGSTYFLAGNTQGAFEAYQTGITQYPQSYQSYLGLIELVENGFPVDQFQRGLVDYHAKAYIPAVDAFQTYISQTVGTANPGAETVDAPSAYRADAHLFLAWSYEGLGNPQAALQEIENYRLVTPADDATVLGTYIREKAGLQTRAIAVSDAIITLQEFVNENPSHPDAPWASYRSAVLADRFRGDFPTATDLYKQHATLYPADENASAALFRAGMLRWQSGDVANARLELEAAAQYPDESGGAALTWLIRIAEDPAPFLQQAANVRGSGYYTLRALSLGQGEPAYAAPDQFNLQYDEAAERLEVENWIRSHFGLAADAIVSSELAPALQNDGRLIRGQKLWELGELEAAKLEFESIRQGYADNAQLSYQLALHFRDIGIYRSSILAASSVLNRAGVSVFDAPKLIGRLAYPVYYADMVVPLAEQYDYDPLLQFALIRQESLFESFIASSAAAQGLSQIIPDTGVYIAGKLAWADYKNEDLYRPYLNLTFGSYYLDQQLELFDGQVAPALAAYNAGPGNAIGWHNTAGDDHDLYLETVNFSETRTYIRRIYIGHAVYRHLYGTEISE